MENGAAIGQKLRKDRTGGIPWMVVLDPDGNELTTSDGPNGNIGCPVREHEVEYFVEMIRKSSPSMPADHLAKIAEATEVHAKQYR